MLNLSHETEVLAARLAEAQRLPVDIAVRQALEVQARPAGVLPHARQRRDTSPEAVARRKASIGQTIADFAALPVLDPRSPNEIMDDINSP
jgi:antitoxin VapB